MVCGGLCGTALLIALFYPPAARQKVEEGPLKCFPKDYSVSSVDTIEVSWEDCGAGKNATWISPNVLERIKKEPNAKELRKQVVPKPYRARVVGFEVRHTSGEALPAPNIVPLGFNTTINITFDFERMEVDPHYIWFRQEVIGLPDWVPRPRA